jgi:hypothetical protein
LVEAGAEAGAEGGASETVEADFVVVEGEVSEAVAVLETEVVADFEVVAEGLVAVVDLEADETILAEEDSGMD